MRSRSKMTVKFCTFHPSTIIRREVGETSVLILRAWRRTKPLIYFRRDRCAVWDCEIRTPVRKRTAAKCKSADYVGRPNRQRLEDVNLPTTGQERPLVITRIVNHMALLLNVSNGVRIDVSCVIYLKTLSFYEVTQLKTFERYRRCCQRRNFGLKSGEPSSGRRRRRMGGSGPDPLIPHLKLCLWMLHISQNVCLKSLLVALCLTELSDTHFCWRGIFQLHRVRKRCYSVTPTWRWVLYQPHVAAVLLWCNDGHCSTSGAVLGAGVINYGWVAAAAVAAAGAVWLIHAEMLSLVTLKHLRYADGQRVHVSSARLRLSQWNEQEHCAPDKLSSTTCSALSASFPEK